MKNFTLFLFSLILTMTAFGQDLVINVTLCDDTANTVRMTGGWWGWDAWAGPEAVSNGDGTWTFTMEAPAADMEYKLVVNGQFEDLTDEPCIINQSGYFNRFWYTTDPLENDITFGQCAACTSTKISNASATYQNIKVFPNPATNYLNIATTTDYKRLNIVNIYGSVVKDFRLIGNFNVLDLNGIAPGIYLVNAFSQDGVFTKQITVK